MKYTLILNPVAGNGSAVEIGRKIEALLQQENVEYRLLTSEYAGHSTVLAHEAASDPETDAIISIGGDGTSFEVACGLIGTNKPMGIVPAGTGNDFIKTLGIPKDPLEAVKYILTAQPRPVDVGKINDRIFLNVCGTGFDVTVLDYAEEEKKKFKGLMPYLIGLIKAIAHYKPFSAVVCIDGKTEEKSMLICAIANGRFFGGGIPICPDADPADHCFDLITIDPLKKGVLPFYLPGLLFGKDLKWKATKRRKVQSVKIDCPGMRVDVDGEILQMDKAEFTILPNAMMMYW